MSFLEYLFVMVEAILLIQIGSCKLISGACPLDGATKLSARVEDLLTGLFLLGGGVYFYLRTFFYDTGYSAVYTSFVVGYHATEIISFVCSPPPEDRRRLISIGRKALIILVLTACLIICFQ